MATKNSKTRDVLSELFANRESNIREALSWPTWEIEDQLKRAKTAKEGFLAENPMHDLSIIEEHISQLEQSLKVKNDIDKSI